MDRARQRSLAGVALNLAVDAGTARVAAELTSRGVGFIVLKGPSFRQWLYPSGERIYGDTDLLVPPHDRRRAEECLTDLGYRPLRFLRDRDFPSHAVSWKTDGPAVDLHHTLVGVDVDPETLWSVLSNETEQMTVSGREVPVLNAPGRLLHIALHVVQHPFNTKTREDLERALATVPIDQWERARDLADRLGAGPSFRTGIELAPDGLAMSKQLRLDPSKDARALLRAAGNPQGAITSEWLLRQRSARWIVTLAIGRLFPVPTYMRLRYRIANKGKMGLFAAYVVRPFHLLLIAPIAFTRAIKARREAK